MRVVVATAEPFASYHLVPLVAAVEDLGCEVTHLLPAAHATQGQAFPVSSDLAVVRSADRVVCSGGALVPWTELVARFAAGVGVDVSFCELACGEASPLVDPPVFDRVMVASTGSARVVASHLGPVNPDPVVVGSPLLDSLPARSPVPARVLAVSSVSSECPDGGVWLRRSLERLSTSGADVVLRCHPREPVGLWDGYCIDDSSDAAAFRSASAVFGYPGTVFTVAAAMGVPVYAAAFEEWMLGRVPRSVAAVSSPVRCLDDLEAVVSSPTACPPDVISDAVGPVGGSANRMLSAVLAAR